MAIKAGMTQEWDEWGKLVPLTVLWIDECQVGIQTSVVSFCNLNLFQCSLIPKGGDILVPIKALNALSIERLDALQIDPAMPCWPHNSLSRSCFESHDAEPLQVVQVKTTEKEGFNSLQLGIGSKREKQLPGRYNLIHCLSKDICLLVIQG